MENKFFRFPLFEFSISILVIFSLWQGFVNQSTLSGYDEKCTWWYDDKVIIGRTSGNNSLNITSRCTEWIDGDWLGNQRPDLCDGLCKKKVLMKEIGR